MFANTMKRAGIGFLLGIAVGNIIVWIGGMTSGSMVSPELAAGMGSETGAMAFQTVLMGLYGAVSMSGMSLYEIESWTLARSTVVHYLIIAVMFLLMDKVLGWGGSPSEIFIVELILRHSSPSGSRSICATSGR